MIEVAIAVGLSGVRLLPMVVALMPVLRGPQTRARQLLLPAHFTAVSMWVESMRLAPQMPVERRIPFCNGLACGYMLSAIIATIAGYLLAARLPETFRPLVPISAATGEGVRALVLRTGALLDRLGPANQENAAERF